MSAAAAEPPIEWTMSEQPVPYEAALALMEERVGAIVDGSAPELVWLLEHPPLYTAGTRARPSDIVDPGGLPVYWTGRGGEVTYHGPGQRLAYVMLDVRRRFGNDVRAFVGALEQWIIDALASLGVVGERRGDRVGVWARRRSASEDEEMKIAAIGIRLRRGVSFHGVSLNIAPDLARYAGIVPCGIRDRGVTSLADLGITASTKDVDYFLKAAFERRFGAVKAVRGLPSGHAPASMAAHRGR